MPIAFEPNNFSGGGNVTLLSLILAGLSLIALGSCLFNLMDIALVSISRGSSPTSCDDNMLSPTLLIRIQAFWANTFVCWIQDIHQPCVITYERNCKIREEALGLVNTELLTNTATTTTKTGCEQTSTVTLLSAAASVVAIIGFPRTLLKTTLNNASLGAVYTFDSHKINFAGTGENWPCTGTFESSAPCGTYLSK